ncbi:MAG: hypothetical protein HY924_15815 [Elusimicrobia bacterium]|nr:hypothetical protein [Elusimicrobiota bacterium]
MPNLKLPVRYDNLSQQASTDQLRHIIEPVVAALDYFDATFNHMGVVGSGQFLILLGRSGSGKSTFLNTIPFFRPKAFVSRIPPSLSHNAITRELMKAVSCAPKTGIEVKIIIMEGREAVGEVSDKALDEIVHRLNQFLRSTQGKDVIFVWPCTDHALATRLANHAKRIGAEALINIDQPILSFDGLTSERFIPVANKTVGLLNNSATLTDFGFSQKELTDLSAESATIGAFLSSLGNAWQRHHATVSRVLQKRRPTHLWIIVAAGNDPVGDVVALTRGNDHTLDLARALSCTQGNASKGIEKQISSSGSLALSIDVRILHLPITTVLPIVRSFAAPSLASQLQRLGLVIAKVPTKAKDKLKASSLVNFLKGKTIPMQLARGRKADRETANQFNIIVKFAQNNDIAINECIAEGLRAINMRGSIGTEDPFGENETARTDILVERDDHDYRIEFMWRAKATRGLIADYALKKLLLYGRALNILT